MLSEFRDISISASVSVVPKSTRSIDDEINLFGGNKSQINRLKKVIGLNERRVVDDSTTCLDLCHKSAQVLLENLELSARDLDVIIFVTQTPDHSQPNNASLLHSRLDCSLECATFDVSLGCSGFVYALWLAFSLISNSASSKVLVLTGDTLSKLVNKRDRTVAPLFGDAGSATLVEFKEGIGKSFFRLGSNGQGSDALKVPAGGSKLPCSRETVKEFADEDGNIRNLENLCMDGAAVFNFSIDIVPQEIESLLKFAKESKDSIDYYIMHQANKYIVNNISKRVRVDPSKFPISSFGSFGNVSSSSIPLAMSFELKEFFNKEISKKILLSGFGVGLSWGSCILPLNSLKMIDWFDY